MRSRFGSAELRLVWNVNGCAPGQREAELRRLPNNCLYETLPCERDIKLGVAWEDCTLWTLADVRMTRKRNGRSRLTQDEGAQATAEAAAVSPESWALHFMMAKPGDMTVIRHPTAHPDTMPGGLLQLVSEVGFESTTARETATRADETEVRRENVGERTCAEQEALHPVAKGERAECLTLLEEVPTRRPDEKSAELEHQRREIECCAACGVEGANKRCTACKAVVYCGQSCQRQHWSTHKEFCRRLAEKQPLINVAPDPTNVKLLQGEVMEMVRQLTSVVRQLQDVFRESQAEVRTLQEKYDKLNRRLQASTTTKTAQDSFALGSINPELYSSTGDEEGEWEHPGGPSGADTPRICFSLHYELGSERLHVTLLKAQNLWLPGGRAGNPEGVGDPLVKVFLLPDERRHVQSKIRRKTAHPTFNETFVFQVSHGSLGERTLRLSALAVDSHRKHRALGHALLPMRAHAQRCARARLVLWRELDADALEPSSEHGDVHFSLSYNAYLSRLTVVVLRAKGLRFHGETSELEVHVRATLLNQNQRVRDKSTGRARGSPSPLYNETLSFPLPPSNLDSSSLSLSVVHTGTGAGDGGELTLGRVVVGPFMYARGRGLEHWEEMIAKPKDMIKRWHALSPDS